MTFYYQTSSWSSQPQITQETIDLWKHVADKSNWRIVQLPNGFYQTEHQDQKENFGKRCKANIKVIKGIIKNSIFSPEER